MARLVIVTHEFDCFAYSDPATGQVTSVYMLWEVLKQLGHDCTIAAGLTPQLGDVALLHVDASIVTDDYLALAGNYAATINFGTRDITKRRISRLRLSREDDWGGPVIVKANLNSGGKPEAWQNRAARRRGRPAPHPGVEPIAYRILDDKADVEDSAWDNPSLIVEKLITEPDPSGGFAFRTWVFMGSRERCTRFVGPDVIGKAGDAVSHEPVDVPPELRAERERLGFDFGKFDWVMHEGKAILLDANRTPGTARSIEGFMNDGAKNLAAGLDELIAERLQAVSPARPAGF